MQQTVILTLLDLISLKGIFSFGYVLFVLITIGVIIHDKRDPVKALSWIVVLILLPVAGFLLYIVFGRNHRKEKLFNRKELHDLEQIDEMSREQVYAINNAALLLRSEITENRDIITLLLNSNKALLTNHNRIRVLNNGTVTFDEIKAAVTPEAQEIITRQLGSFDDYLEKLIEDTVRKIKNESPYLTLSNELLGDIVIDDGKGKAAGSAV